jgi:hypothetical protein
MSGTRPIPWFTFSLTMAPEVALDSLRGPPVPELPGGELSEALGVELVYDVPAPDWGGRVARLADAPGKRVMGLLRFMAPQVWPQVARLEAELVRAREERTVRVRTASGAILSAKTFSPSAEGSTTQGLVSVTFLVALAHSAELAGLPARYVEQLQAEAHLVQKVQKAGKA